MDGRGRRRRVRNSARPLTRRALNLDHVPPRRPSDLDSPNDDPLISRRALRKLQGKACSRECW